MLKTLRQVVEKTSSGTEEDVNDKRKIKELETAVLTLERTQQYYLKTFVDFNANAAAYHVDLANVYPANETLSTAVMQLNASGGVFKDATAIAEQIRDAMARPLAEIKARIKLLNAKADERQVVRAEITHYREKVTRLANDGLHNMKAQTKAESNQEKLLRNQQRFKDLDEELQAELNDLDHQVAEVTNAALARFIQLQAGYAGGLLHCYGNAMAAVPGTLPAAPASMLPAAGAPGGEAVAVPAAGGAGAAPTPGGRASMAAPAGAAAVALGADGNAKALFPADEAEDVPHPPAAAAASAAPAAPAAPAGDVPPPPPPPPSSTLPPPPPSEEHPSEGANPFAQGELA